MTRCSTCGPWLWVCESVLWPFQRRLGGQHQAPRTRSSRSDLDHSVSLPFLLLLSYSSLSLLCLVSSVQALSPSLLSSPPRSSSLSSPGDPGPLSGSSSFRPPAPRSLPASGQCRPAWHSAAMGMFEPGAAPNGSCWSHVASGCFGVADAAEEPHLQTFYYIFINFNFSRLMCQRPLNWTREL